MRACATRATGEGRDTGAQRDGRHGCAGGNATDCASAGVGSRARAASAHFLHPTQQNRGHSPRRQRHRPQFFLHPTQQNRGRSPRRCGFFLHHPAMLEPMKPLVITAASCAFLGVLLVIAAAGAGAVTVSQWRPDPADPFYFPPFGELAPSVLLLGAGAGLLNVAVFAALLVMHAHAIREGQRA